MDAFCQTQAIFEQLARTDGAGGVRTIIENHDAWSHGSAAMSFADAAVHRRLGWGPRDAGQEARIRAQRQRLAGLVVPIRSRISTAG